MNDSLPPGSAGPRTPASAARRDAVLAILDAARADGRLSSAEHQERYRIAALSRFDEELTPQISDLNLRPLELELRTTGLWADDPFANQWEFGPFRSGKRNATQTMRERLTLPALGALVLGMVVFAVITADGLTQVLDSARAEFAGHPVESLFLSRHGAALVHEDPERPGTRSQHRFDGSWDADTRQDRPAEELRGVLFTLDSVDEVALTSAVEQAPALLGIPDGIAQYVTIRGDVLADPTYTVSVKAVSASAGERSGSVEFARDGQVREISLPG